MICTIVFRVSSLFLIISWQHHYRNNYSLPLFSFSEALDLSSTSTQSSLPQKANMPPRLIVATRLHLGQAQEPPSNLQENIERFCHFCIHDCRADAGIVAVDADDTKIPNYSLQKAVQHTIDQLSTGHRVHVLPVTPWGKFVPALNALLGSALRDHQADQICFVSAETNATRTSMEMLQSHLNEHTLMVGARLVGHNFQPGKQVPLDGTTCPWNTLSIWNARKLARTGFLHISDGLLCEGGIEEVEVVAMQQQLFPDEAACKLVELPGVDWAIDFDDPKRKEWHEFKMKSKIDRAKQQLSMLGGLTGVVQHIALPESSSST